MKLYKLTNNDGRTFGDCQWGENVTHGSDELEEGDGPLCSGHWYHAYQDPILAIFMNPAHAWFGNPQLWEAEGNIGLERPDKVGCKELTTIKKIPLPEITTTQCQAFAILIALEVYNNPEFVKWANNWLSGKDRSIWATKMLNVVRAWSIRATVWAIWHDITAARAAALVAEEQANAGKIDLITIAHKALEYN